MGRSKSLGSGILEVHGNKFRHGEAARSRCIGTSQSKLSDNNKTEASNDPPIEMGWNWKSNRVTPTGKLNTLMNKIDRLHSTEAWNDPPIEMGWSWKSNRVTPTGKLNTLMNKIERLHSTEASNDPPIEMGWS